MIPLEQRLQERFPHWFRGRRALLIRPLLKTFSRWSKLEDAGALLAANAHLRDFAFIEATLDFLQVRYSADPVEVAHIPATGRVLIVANHPSGALDAMALLHQVGRVRPDVRIVANDFLMEIEPMSNLLLPIKILGGRPDPGSVRAIEQALKDEQCVIVFPAGEVSRLGLRGISDTRWQRGFLRFARKTNAPVLPVRIHARNSAFFYGASALFKPIGTALLAREMFARRARTITLRIGEPTSLPAESDTASTLHAIRQQLYALGKRKDAPPIGPEPIVAAVDPAAVRAAVELLESLGTTSDGKQIRVGVLATDSPLLREIGRQRELTFRQVGEGTGRHIDLDVYDSWYEHIVLWDDTAQKIAGAYRVARGATTLANRGLAGLYTASLFHYADSALPRIAEGLELGRSFVAPEYWGSRSIDYLWQGIGAYLRRHPHVRYLFGAVSISAALPPQARDQIVAYYTHYYGVPQADAFSKRPFQYHAAAPQFAEIDADASFRVLKANLDAFGASVPMLYKQYVDLCEPGGVRFLAFGVDPEFSNSVDGLIEVDLHYIRPKKRARYIENAAAEAVARVTPQQESR